MTKEQLQERILKTQSKITKIERRIKKWQDARCEQAFIKANEWLLNMGKDREYLWNEYIKNCNWELDRAVQDLHDTQLTLEKYQNLLKLEEAKDNEFENNRIIVIWNFLLNYKEQVAKYIRNNINILNEYYKVNSEACEWYNHKYSIIEEQHITNEEWKEHYKELDRKERELKSNIHPITNLVAIRNYPEKVRTVNEAKLEEILIKDCKARYFQLVNEVTEITGIITDATNLTIHGGELNGNIIGEKGTASVNTFSAGGWNIQCFHYRTKVTKLNINK